MAWRSLTDKQWDVIKSIYQKDHPAKKVVDHLQMTVNALRAYSGFFGQVPPGANYRKNTELKAK